MSRQSDGVLMVPEPSDLPLSSSSPGTVSTNGGGRSEGLKPQHPPPMADWFKVHNDLLDDDNFQYALTRTFSAGTVYIALLSKASKLRCDTIPFDNCALIGLSHRLHIGAGILNEAISALIESGYLSKEGEVLKVVMWDKVQSDYNRGISRKSPRKSDKLRTNSDTTSTEERRGEEKKPRRRRLPPPMTPLPGEVLYERTGQMPHEFQ